MAATIAQSAISCASALSTAACGVEGASRRSTVVALGSSLRGSSLKSISRLQTKVAKRSLKASSEEAPPSTTSADTEKIVADLKEKWDKIENKPAVALYAGGAVTLVWLSSAVVGAISAVPLLPKLLELVGVGYTGWFVYRYLLFKSSRKELASEIEELKNKITGATGLDEK